jgi:hypothetical protein
MIRAGRVAAYAKPADHLLIIIIQRDTAAKGDDPAKPEPGSAAQLSSRCARSIRPLRGSAS